MAIKLNANLTISDGTNNYGSLKDLFPKILYSNPNGTTGAITLSEAIENYKYVEIESFAIFASTHVYANTGKIPTSSAGRIHLSNSFIGVNGLDYLCKRISILGTELTVASDREVYLGNTSDGNYTYITKIIGYK